MYIVHDATKLYFQVLKLGIMYMRIYIYFKELNYIFSRNEIKSIGWKDGHILNFLMNKKQELCFYHTYLVYIVHLTMKIYS